MEFEEQENYQDSPPYVSEEEEEEEEKCFFPNPGADLWEKFSFPTPPLSPVNPATRNEKYWRAASGPLYELREISEEDLPEELFSSSDLEREISEARAESPAILNDIMWNAGERVKRPDSAMDIDIRFSLNTTPVCFDQQITSTFVETEELFSFSLFDNQQENEHHTQEHENLLPKSDNNTSTFQELSDSDEEIDVVSIQADTRSEQSTPTIDGEKDEETLGDYEGIQEQISLNDRPQQKPRFSQRSKDRKEENSTSDSENETTRISHNDLERKRRNELRNRFNTLRESLPELKHNEKAAKITVLRKAYELVPALQKEELRLIAEKEAEKRRNSLLLSKLVKLTRAGHLS